MDLSLKTMGKGSKMDPVDILFFTNKIKLMVKNIIGTHGPYGPHTYILFLIL